MSPYLGNAEWNQLWLKARVPRKAIAWNKMNISSLESMRKTKSDWHAIQHQSQCLIWESNTDAVRTQTLSGQASNTQLKYYFCYFYIYFSFGHSRATPKHAWSMLELPCALHRYSRDTLGSSICVREDNWKIIKDKRLMKHFMLNHFCECFKEKLEWCDM